MTEAWQQKRIQLNHDWLKNTYIGSIDGFLSRVKNTGYDPSRIQEFLLKTLPEWEKKKAELEWLIQHFQDEMSPKQLFKVPPLGNLDKSEQNWLRDLMDRLWKTRYPVSEWELTAEDKLFKANDTYESLKVDLNFFDENVTDSTIMELKRLIPHFNTFRGQCLDLSSAISRFPRKVFTV